MSNCVYFSVFFHIQIQLAVRKFETESFSWKCSLKSLIVIRFVIIVLELKHWTWFWFWSDLFHYMFSIQLFSSVKRNEAEKILISKNKAAWNKSIAVERIGSVEENSTNLRAEILVFHTKYIDLWLKSITNRAAFWKREVFSHTSKYSEVFFLVPFI